MRTFALVLASLVCGAHAVKATEDLKALATLLGTFSPASAFAPSGPGLRSPSKLGAPIQPGTRSMDALMSSDETKAILAEVMKEFFGGDLAIPEKVVDETLQPMYEGMKEKKAAIAMKKKNLSLEAFDDFKKSIADVDAFYKEIGVDNSFPEKADMMKKLDSLWATYSRLLQSEVDLEKETD